MNNIDIIIKMLLEKTNLSELEKDIVESYNTYLKEDKKDIISKIVENRIKYNMIAAETSVAKMQTQGKTQLVSFDNLTNDELKNNLYNQILLMCTKLNTNKN